VSPCSAGYPRRTAIGCDHNRVSLIAAVMERRCKISILNKDIFVNVTGGIQIEEPAIDMGIALSMASSLMDRPIEGRTVIFGEIGLSGEVRAVSSAELRCREALKLGYKTIIHPDSNRPHLEGMVTDASLIAVRSLGEALSHALSI
jgi:DNA repair protein RadA/Sms